MSVNKSPKVQVAIVLAALLYAVCWLIPNHHQPWVDFYADAWAAMIFGVGALGVCLVYKKSLRIELHVLPLAVIFLIILVFFQYASGLIEAFGVFFISCLYLSGFVLALIFGAAWEKVKSNEGADFLFMAVFVGGCLSFIVQLQQWLEINPGSFFWLFLPSANARFSANVGQPNQLATLLCLSVISCVWFYARGYFAGWVAWIFSILLAFAIVLTESRTAWLNVLVCYVFFLIYRRQIFIKKIFSYALFAWFVIFLFFIFVLPYLSVYVGRSNEVQSLRGMSSITLRLDYWMSLLDSVMDRPIWGYGWMQAGFAQFVANPYELVGGGTFRHTHNILLDFFVELGIPLGLFFCAVLFGWFFVILGRVKSIEQILMCIFLIVLVVHAFLEFPLHYAYFLLMFGLMAGGVNSSLCLNSLLNFSPRVLIFFLMVVILSFVLVVHDYFVVEKDFFKLRFESKGLERSLSSNPPNVFVLTQLQDLIWLARVDPANSHSAKDIERALRTMKLLPNLVANYKLAAMYALEGDVANARYWLVVMSRLNKPEQRLVDALYNQWEINSKDYPAMRGVWPE